MAVLDCITLHIGVLPSSYSLRQPAGMSQTHFADNRATSLILPSSVRDDPILRNLCAPLWRRIIVANLAEYVSANRSLLIGRAFWDPLRVKAATDAGRIMNKYQNSFSVIKVLIVGPIV